LPAANRQSPRLSPARIAAEVKLGDYLKKNKQSDPPVGTVGVESDWMDTGTVEVTTGSLWAGDPFVCNAEDGCVVKVPPGVYALEARAMEFAGRKRVSRLRVYLQGTQEPALGKKVGETLTDTGMMAVCDIVALDQAIGGDYDRFNELVTQRDYKDCGVVQFEMKKPIAIPYASTAFGDGDATVFELKSGRRRVGMELEFLPPGYVFEGFEEDDEEEEAG
jgi:hypothetical protein